VARVEVFLARDQAIARPIEAVIDREGRPTIGRPHIRKDDAAVLMRGVGAVMEPVLESAFIRLPRRFENLPVRRKQPAMVAAAYALGVDQPEFERGPAVWAVQLQQPDGAAPVAERHELLPQDLDAVRQIPQLVGEADRLPEAAQIFAARRARADMGELGILL